MTCGFRVINQWLLSACTSRATQVGAHHTSGCSCGNRQAAKQPKTPALVETMPAWGTSVLWGLKLHMQPEPVHGDGDTKETRSPPTCQQLHKLCLALALSTLALLPTHQL